MTFPKYHRDIGPLQNNETIILISTELIEKILRCAWLSPMSKQERIAFTSSIALVSKTWFETFIRIKSRDVYILSTSYTIAHCRPFPFILQSLPDASSTQLCRTITRQILFSDKITKLDRLSFFQGKSFQHMLFTFHSLPIMPNLRTSRVEYYNPAFERDHFLPFYAPIVQLNLEYTFASDCPHWLIDALLAMRHPKSKHLPWTLPPLEHISTPVNEDSTASIAIVLDSCPHLRLAEERFTIHVRVLSSSRRVPENCIIFHGVMPSSEACVMNHHDFGPKMVRGSASILILTKGDRSTCGPLVDLANMLRNVHVFIHKNK